MIIAKQRKNVWGIKQEDHAHLAAWILEQWNDHRFKRDENYDLIIRATREHDNGWREYDKAPRVDGRTRFPVDFKSINAEEAYEIWMRGSRRFIDDDPFVALMITHHAYSLHEHAHNRDGVWKEFFVELAKQRGGLRDQLELTHNQVEHAYSFMRIADWFSLNFCNNPRLGSGKPAQYAGYKVRRNNDQFLFRPYPFTERGITYELPVYELNPDGYDDEKEVKKDLKKPATQTIVFNPLEL